MQYKPKKAYYYEDKYEKNLNLLDQLEASLNN